MKKFLLRIIMLFLLTGICGTAEAVPWYQPTDLQPGDTYQLVFVTWEETNGYSTQLSYYVQFVNDSADWDPDLAKLSWSPIISIGESNARDIAVVSSPVYNLYRVRVADDFDDMWDGALDAKINVSSHRTTFDTCCWTGSNSDGTISSNPVGDPASTTVGTTDQKDYRWISYGLGTVSYGMELSVYALSNPITAISQEAPTVTTGSASSVSLNSATLNGTVNPNGLTTAVVFEYGQTSSYGSTVTATQSPLTGTDSQAVSAEITGLSQGTVYHYRVVAWNSGGTVSGDDKTFTTTESSPKCSIGAILLLLK